LKYISPSIKSGKTFIIHLIKCFLISIPLECDYMKEGSAEMEKSRSVRSSAAALLASSIYSYFFVLVAQVIVSIYIWALR
jgi:hypothetical protein